MSKLSCKDKIKIYKLRKKGKQISYLSSKYKVRSENIAYLIRLIDKHGIEIIKKDSNKYYPPYQKEEIINRILIGGESITSVAIDVGLSSDGILHTWIKKYKENGYNIVERKRGRSPTMNKKEFNLRGEKCYLSPILDGFNGEIISYNTSKSPNLEQINDMLNKAFDKNNNLDGLILHSDQGWQYQHQSYQQRLKNKGIKQSMSRKGNSMDNGIMENFFGLLKTEMFYDQEDKYKNIDELIIAIDDYINYYNYDRIKVKLKGLSPVNYRLQSSS